MSDDFVHPAGDATAAGQLSGLEWASLSAEVERAGPIDPCEAAARYAANGFPVFPCKPGPGAPAKKAYTENGFKDASTDRELVRSWWRTWPRALIGCPTGKQFWVLDLDNKNGNSGTKDFANLCQVYGRPSEGRRMSKTPTGGAHVFFAGTNGVGSSASKVIPGIDVRNDGGYIILPPSTLAEGGRYDWVHEDDFPPASDWVLDLARGDLAFMFRAVLAVAKAAEGTRNETLFKAACEVGRHVAGGEIAPDQARDLLEAAAGIAADGGGPLPLREIRSTIESGFREGEKDPKVSGKRMREEMNLKYSVVDVEGEAYVVAFKNDALGRPRPTYYAFDAFRGLHDHIKIGKSGIGSSWLNNPLRPQFEGITFRPGKKGAVVDSDRRLNLWRGFGVEPRPGDWSLMERHIREILAAGNQPHFEYVLRWLAWSVQNPGERAEVVLVFKSDEEGAGKGCLGNTMTRIFGPHGLRVDRHDHLTGKFNTHLQDVSFLFADEAFWPGDKSAEGVLKGLITEPTRMIEPKGVNAYEVPNALHVMMASNNTWTVPAGPTARRFAVFRVSPNRVGDKTYFKALFEQLDRRGREAMLHDLLKMELGEWHPREDVPRTKELLLLEKINTLNAEQKWLIDLLSKGQLPTYPPLEANQVVTQYVYEDYITHSGKVGARHRSVEVLIGRFLKDTFPGLSKSTMTVREKGKDRRSAVYHFPSLQECRQIFDRLLQQPWSWEEPHEWLARSEDEDEGDAAF